jgi:hypothetical protein
MQYINRDLRVEDEDSGIFFDEENISRHKLEFIFNGEEFTGDYDLVQRLQGFR